MFQSTFPFHTPISYYHSLLEKYPQIIIPPSSKMNFPPPEFFAGASDGRPSPTRRELQGPRPTPLKVNKDSYKIKKPPVAPPPHPPPHVAVSTAAPPPSQNPQTVIIYAVSPKVYHTTVSDFMSVVQRLTGSSSESETSTSAAVAGDGNLSPAAKLATIEKASTSSTSPSSSAGAGGVPSIFPSTSYGVVDSMDVLDILGNSTAEMCQIPGILSPAPATLPPVSPPGLFSPFPSDPFMLMLSPSPSTLFSAPLISPSPSASDLFHPFFDF
ncbi:protein MKS1-like [Capsicum annuum]|uniref:protein MKS1-like n=1 Tax=Capsicum annuum TaxID=4072 RepID=UPI0007BF7024|nr:protein MKS1-like [Capsicum annuum]